MNGTQAIQTAYQGTQLVLEMYLSDLADADLLVRPASGSNHIAWQIGHLIVAEQRLVGLELHGASYPALPAGFAEKHSKEAATDSTGFSTKAAYLDLFRQTRAATLAAVAQLTEQDLDRPSSGPLARIAPKLGDLLLLASNHTLMHAGQFVVVRRLLGKPILI